MQAYRLCFIAVLVYLPVLVISCSSSRQIFQTPEFALSSPKNATALCLPVREIATEYFDNTSYRPKPQHEDSFFVEAADGLFPYLVSRKLIVAPVAELLSAVTPERLASVPTDRSNAPVAITTVLEKATTLRMETCWVMLSQLPTVMKVVGRRSQKTATMPSRPRRVP